MSINNRSQKMRSKNWICSNCIHWKHDPSKYGECKINPPIPIPVNNSNNANYTTAWPITHSNDWCGKFTNIEFVENKTNNAVLFKEAK